MRFKLKLAMVVALVGMLMGGGAARANDLSVQSHPAVSPFVVSQPLTADFLDEQRLAQVSNPIDDAPAPWRVTPLETQNPLRVLFDKYFGPKSKQVEPNHRSTNSILDQQALTMLAESAIIAFILLVAVLSIVNHRARQQRLEEEAARRKNKNNFKS
jgi:hypothetical protein